MSDDPKSRLDTLFDAACEIAPGDRGAWLDAHCADDPRLRRALQRLLDADARCGVLDGGVEAFVSAMPAAAPNRFGVWHVVKRLGAGGMGDVWLGERTDADFTQRVAIKQVAYPTPGLLHRFSRERRILAQLDHPGIARLVDGGADASGCPYLAMEYVEGPHIDAWVRDNHADTRAIVELLLKVCDAVAFAHRNLVIHGDIKPSNIVVAAGSAPRLLDFGVARVTAEDGQSVTATTTTMLTPDYAAPELLTNGNVTTAVDVYALGVLACELLCGRKPYHLRKGAARSLESTTTRSPSALVDHSIADWRARQRQLRGDLDRIVLTAMAREPGRRYASVEALAADLRRWLAGRAVNARGDDAWYRLRKFIARHRVAVAAAVVVVAVLVGATVFSLRQARVAVAQAQRAEAVRQFIHDTFAQMDPADNRGNKLDMRELLRRSERRLADDRNMPRSVRADLTTLIGKMYWDLADNVASERVLKEAVALADDGGVPADTRARSLLALATTENDRGETANTFRHANLALALARTSKRPDADLVADAERLVASAAIGQLGPARAEPLLRKQLAADHRRYGDSPVVVKDLIALGQSLDAMARYDEAEAALGEATSIAKSLDDNELSYLGLAADVLGVIRLRRGNYVGADTAFATAGQVTAKLWGKNSVRTSITRAQHLRVAVMRGRFAASVPAIAALRDQAAAMRKDRPDHYAETCRLLGDAYLGSGQFAAAERAYRRALEAWSTVPEGARSEGLAATMSGLATSLMWQGRLADAEASVRRAIELDRNASVAAGQAALPAPALARDRARLAQILGFQGRADEALATARAAAAALPTAAGGQSPTTAAVRARLANALLAAGKPDAALAEATHAQGIAERVLPKGNWQRAEMLLALGRSRQASGQSANAKASLVAALALRQSVFPASDPRVRVVRAALTGASRPKP